MPLSPSDKIRLLTEISRRLAAEDWPVVDLTLRQFRLHTSDRWNGSKEDYILAMVEAGAEANVMALGEHVGVALAQRAVRVAPRFWRRGCLRLFISHTSTHKADASALQNALSDVGISGFVAHEDIEPSAEWQGEIETALATMDAMAALLHPGFHASRWTDQEVGFALGRGIPVFAFRAGEDPYGFMGRIQAFSTSGKSPVQIAQELVAVLSRHKQTAQCMAEALVELFKESVSFAEAKTNIGLLENMTYWHPNFAAELSSAVANNDQLEQAFGVPERVDGLIDRHSQSDA